MSKNKKSYLMPTYGKRNLEFVRGQGCYLYTSKNSKYLDFGAGIAVNSFGHCHPTLVKTLQTQANKLWHTSNLYLNPVQEMYAKLICKNSFAEKIFFTNSGAESIECGIKVIRSYHFYHKNYSKKNILTFEGAFHGRTFAALSAQKNKKYSEGFGPLIPGFVKVPFNDVKALKKAINKNTAAVLIEPIQGEGGIRPAELKFLQQLSLICKKNDALLFLDEIQCGFGRSGKLFSHEWANIKPDLVATAKGIGSGFPMGACLATKKASIGMIKGTHGSTYGGNPLAISIGKKVLELILKKDFLKKVDSNARYLWKKLKILEKKYDEILEIRGAGFLLGIKTKRKNTEVIQAISKNKLLLIAASENIIRVAPPLIVTKKEIDNAIFIIEKTLNELND